MKIKVAIPSHNRVDILKNKALKLLEWMDCEITIFANPKGEAEKYRKEFPDLRIIEIAEFNWMGKLRAEILNHYEEGDFILMIDDDIGELKILVWKKIESMSKKISQEFIVKAFNHLKNTWNYLWWICPTDNAFYMSEKICRNKFIIGCFMGIIKTDLNFDSEIYWKEDYDFTLQNILTYWWADRHDYIATDNKYWTTKGGLQDTKRANIAQRDIQLLKNKYWDIIRDNPKRPNEILLNLRNYG